MRTRKEEEVQGGNGGDKARDLGAGGDGAGNGEDDKDKKDKKDKKDRDTKNGNSPVDDLEAPPPAKPKKKGKKGKTEEPAPDPITDPPKEEATKFDAFIDIKLVEPTLG